MQYRIITAVIDGFVIVAFAAALLFWAGISTGDI